MFHNSDYTVDLNKIHLNRKPGISGMMRVKNDAEFIIPSVESCIDALDELIIVYNGCTDNSPEIIHRIALKYPSKIKVYHYEPTVICGSLTKEEYERAKSLSEDSVELLANYYNYALSKTTRTHVMKIDADQIYFTENLKQLCDRLRNPSLKKLSLSEIKSFYKLAKKLRYFEWKIGDNTERQFKRYRNVLEYLCAKGILSISLSGINIFMNKMETYVTQGLKTNGLNILAQFNGTSDHLIFKVRKGTRFKPFDCTEYNLLTSSQYTYIEHLTGNPRPFSWGFMWWHLNAMRSKIYLKQQENLSTYPDSFIPIKDFIGKTSDDLQNMFNSEFVSQAMKSNYIFYWENCKNEIPLQSFKI